MMPVVDLSTEPMDLYGFACTTGTLLLRVL